MAEKIITIIILIISSQNMYTQETKTISKLNLKRYMGLWYEIARYDNWFEKDLVGVTAEYTIMSNNRIQVINSGHKYELNGQLKKSVGKAKQPDPNKPGELKVSFFLWFYGDYNILMLDEENYSYALVGSNEKKYLWILSRTPQLPKNTLDEILKYAEALGYNTSKLYYTPQK
ncbi:MAG: lipocalin family protein [Bacteroidales bacterium]